MENWEDRIWKVDRAPGDAYMERLDGVVIRIAEWDGRQRVIIELEPDASSTELRNAIPSAVGTWLQRIREDEHPYYRTREPDPRLYWSEWQAAGATWAQVADAINGGIARALQASVTDKWNLGLVRYFLKSAGIPSDEWDEIIEDGLENVKDGKKAFSSPDYPVTREKARERIEYWRRAKT